MKVQPVFDVFDGSIVTQIGYVNVEFQRRFVIYNGWITSASYIHKSNNLVCHNLLVAQEAWLFDLSNGTTTNLTQSFGGPVIVIETPHVSASDE
ncbi:MAG: hypothetical protein H7175_06185 [Burkholderiales bacterium]|nr:hypothetical protein [Anaerolineae bacterium]